MGIEIMQGRNYDRSMGTDISKAFIINEVAANEFGGERMHWENAGNYWKYILQTLEKIHLTSDLNGEIEPNGNIQYVYIFAFVGLIILLIASINFMNLSTARSASRAREVGVKKVAGTSRGSLISQFLT